MKENVSGCFFSEHSVEQIKQSGRLKFNWQFGTTVFLMWI